LPAKSALEPLRSRHTRHKKKPPNHGRLTTYTSQSHCAMNPFSISGLRTRSLDAALPVDVHALLRQSIADQVKAIIKQHPSCPQPASYQVEAQNLTAKRLGGK